MSSRARHLDDRVGRAAEAAADVCTGRGRLLPTHGDLGRLGRLPHQDDGRTPGEAGYVRRGSGGETGPRIAAVLRKWSAPAS